jgi:hypothetical protein
MRLANSFRPLRGNVFPSHIFLPPPLSLVAASRLTHKRQLEVTQRANIPPSPFHLPVALGQRLDPHAVIVRHSTFVFYLFLILVLFLCNSDTVVSHVHTVLYPLKAISCEQDGIGRLRSARASTAVDFEGNINGSA